MIGGLGIDLVEIARIERAMRNPRFVYRVLTEAERVACRTPESVAGRWAAKEAVAKALGVPVTWQQVEILTGKSGAPQVRLSVFGYESVRLFVSITHERQFAAAVAVLEVG